MKRVKQTARMHLPRDVAYAATTSGLFVTGPQMSVNIDDPQQTPPHLVDQLIANGGFSQGAVKIRTVSPSGRPTPKPFEDFNRGEWCAPFGPAATDPDLLTRYYEFGIEPLDCDYAYARWRNVVKASTSGGMTLRSVIGDWESRGLMLREDNMTPDRALTNAFRRYRSVLVSEEFSGLPYITDWNCSLFQMHYVDPSKSDRWQQDHYFGVRPSILVFQRIDKFFSFPFTIDFASLGLELGLDVSEPLQHVHVGHASQSWPVGGHPRWRHLLRRYQGLLFGLALRRPRPSVVELPLGWCTCSLVSSL
jgi:hypothetical protein